MYPLLTPSLCEAVACSDVRATENLLLSCGDPGRLPIQLARRHQPNELFGCVSPLVNRTVKKENSVYSRWL